MLRNRGQGQRSRWPNHTGVDDHGCDRDRALQRGIAVTKAMTVGTEDDAALLLAVRGGDDAAFDRLMFRYQAKLRGMCWNYLHDADLVDDILQDTFCNVLESHNRIDAEFNVSSWMHRIAANLCIDELRRRTRRSQTHVAGAAFESELLAVLDDDRRGRPEDALELKTVRAMVRAAIDSLPARQRDVLIMRDVRRMSEAEVALSLGLTTGAVQGMLHRARETFREAYVAAQNDAAASGECGQVTFTFQHLRISSLRRDRLKALERHVEECARCRPRFLDLLPARQWTPLPPGAEPAAVVTAGDAAA